MIQVTTNEAEFRADMKKARRKMTPHAAFKSAGKLLGARLMAFTPPRTLEQGMRSTANDIRKAVRPLSDQWITETFEFDPKLAARLKFYGDTENFDALKTVLKGFGITEVYDHFPREYYHSRRDSRGRVRGKTRAVTLAVNETNAFIDMKQQRVGMAKGGWYAGATMFGLTNIAPWIADKAGLGSATDQSLDLTNPYIEFANRSVWGQHHDEAGRTANNALKAVESLVVGEMAKEIQREAA